MNGVDWNSFIFGMLAGALWMAFIFILFAF